jgi:tetratricopeptide (TPR) repeat protein
MNKILLPQANTLWTLTFLVFLMLWTNCLGDEGWLEDLASGLEKAQREKKDGLILFTGSDWCPPCIKLEQEILSRPEFLAEAAQRFVLIKLDFPRNSPQPEKIAEQNKLWAKEYGVDAFPTLLLVDAAGKPFAVAGFSDEGVVSYLGMLEQSRQIRIARDEKLKIAEEKIGLQRAVALDEAVSLIREELVSAYYSEIIAEILELDKKDELGLRTKWNSAGEAELRRAVLTDIMLISRIEKPDRAIAFIDEVLSELDFPVRENLAIMNIKLNLLRERASQTGDLTESVQLLDRMANLDGITRDTRDRLLVKKINLFFEVKQQEEAWQILEQALRNNPQSVYLHKAKGDFFEAINQLDQAVAAYTAAIERARSLPDVLIEVVSAKADALFDQGQEGEALATLDSFIDDNRQPADLRAQALLHKSLIMRETNRIRQARLAENRAVEISQSAQSKREVQNLVDKIRAKFGD